MTYIMRSKKTFTYSYEVLILQDIFHPADFTRIFKPYIPEEILSNDFVNECRYLPDHDNYRTEL